MQRNRGNNRMGKSRDLFKKIRDTKGTFHAKMGIIKDRNGMDLTEAEDIKKRWQEYTEELYRKHLHNPDNHESSFHPATGSKLSATSVFPVLFVFPSWHALWLSV